MSRQTERTDRCEASRDSEKAGWRPVCEKAAALPQSGRQVPDGPSSSDRYLLTETAIVFAGVLLAAGAIGRSQTLEVGWLLTPLVLILGGLVPTAVRRRGFAAFGLTRARIGASLAFLGWTCAALFPLAFAGLWVLKSFDIGLPAAAALPQGIGWIGWLFYQFMYVALSEEVFFRGYVLSNVLSLAEPLVGGRRQASEWASIALSAVCFAVAHVVVQGQVVFLMTFLPGLVLGWLYFRTKSLLAPILFHGLANVCYALMGGVFG